LIVAISSSMPVLFAVGFGSAVAIAVAVFLQVNMCGLSVDDWGPFEGLKGVPGWEESTEPDDSAAAPRDRSAISSGDTQTSETSHIQSSGKNTDASVASAPGAEDDPASGTEAPLLHAEAPEAGADDLKRIVGIGPKLEQELNSLGVYHFSQIAGWSEANITFVDSKLRFKGRIQRDNWVDQAQALSKA
jgi:NADH-quinone oxidoreductase subunit E